MSGAEVLSMTDSEQLTVICIAVVCVVVFFYGLAFYMAFKRSHRYQTAMIAGRTMDEEIAEYLVGDSYGYFTASRLPDGEGHPLTLREYRERKRKSEGAANLASNVFLGVFYVLILAILGLGIYFRAAGEQIYIGDYSYMVIQSGSMSKKNKANAYLYDEDLIAKYGFDNQIQTFDFIQIKRIASPDDISLYDVVAYRDPETHADTDPNMIVCHRVININVVDGVRYFQFRGDYNASSTTFETYGPSTESGGSGNGVPFSSIVGQYTGFHSLPLGLAVDYFRSDIGMICAASGIITLGFFYYYDDRITKAVSEREAYVTDRMDESADRRYKWYLCYYRSQKAYKSLTDSIFID
jgi:hypothetical protein